MKIINDDEGETEKMAQQLVDRRDQEFVIWEQMACEEITTLPPFRAFNKNLIYLNLLNCTVTDKNKNEHWYGKSRDNLNKIFK